ncbi:MAG: hypothetical protein KC561_09925, partial [Myxococcales bacterium]|nr:hypothetical protein [Myxococcales bacterium]
VCPDGTVNEEWLTSLESENIEHFAHESGTACAVTTEGAVSCSVGGTVAGTQAPAFLSFGVGQSSSGNPLACGLAADSRLWCWIVGDNSEPTEIPNADGGLEHDAERVRVRGGYIWLTDSRGMSERFHLTNGPEPYVPADIRAEGNGCYLTADNQFVCDHETVATNVRDFIPDGSSPVLIGFEGQRLVWEGLASDPSNPDLDRTVARIEPVESPAWLASSWEYLAAGDGFFCAVGSEGELPCWGEEPYPAEWLLTNIFPRPDSVGGEPLRLVGATAHADGARFCWAEMDQTFCYSPGQLDVWANAYEGGQYDIVGMSSDGGSLWALTSDNLLLHSDVGLSNPWEIEGTVEDTESLSMSGGFGCYNESSGDVRCGSLTDFGAREQEWPLTNLDGPVVDVAKLSAWARRCAVTAPGTVWCSEGFSEPWERLEVPASDSVHSGPDVTCALTREHELVCAGQSDLCGTFGSEENTWTAATNVADVVLNQLGRACVLNDQGDVSCWVGNSGVGTYAHVEGQGQIRDPSIFGGGDGGVGCELRPVIGLSSH